MWKQANSRNKWNTRRYCKVGESEAEERKKSTKLRHSNVTHPKQVGKTSCVCRVICKKTNCTKQKSAKQIIIIEIPNDTYCQCAGGKESRGIVLAFILWVCK